MFKQSTEYKSIQKKLVAAVAMVLIASLMVVSSSYAWFTLSTAPEVTGITTAVGSNGNLEMALNTYGDVDEITTGTGVSGMNANSTWGNLVDLSYAEYGLDEISLAPARLSWSENSSGADTLGVNYIQTPVYGVDGRISTFETIAQSGKLNSNNQWVYDANHYGVRGIGTASGLSAGAIALRNAKSEVNTARDEVGRLARTSLEVDAINLANLMIANKLAARTTVSAAEWAQVVAAVRNLETIATKLQSTMDKVVNAVAVSAGVDMTGKTITYTADGATVDGLTLPAELQAGLGAAWTTLISINSKLTAANSKITEATANEDGTYNFTYVTAIMGSILSTDNILIDGEKSLDGATKDDMITIVVEAYTANDGKLPMNIVSGIYKEIADFIGHYSAQTKTTIDLTGTDYQSMFPNGASVTLLMKVETDAPTIDDKDTTDDTTDDVVAYYLPYFVTQMNELSASDAGTSTDTVLSDIYAFAVDMAFRTNASGSDLMLQTSAASRVGDDTTASVQGGGSYMEFTIGSTTNGYTVDQMIDLMGAIRVVLYNTEANDGGSYDIYAIAALDMGTAERDDATGTVKAYLYLYDYSYGTNGELVLGEKQTPDSEMRTAITALQQNQALAMTALVYLDGDMVDNTDVAINGDSMTGTLNLQFASSADLEPMDYTFTEDNSEENTTVTLNTPTLAWDATTATTLVITPPTDATGITGYVIVVGNDIANPITTSASNLSVDLSSVLESVTAETEISVAATDGTNTSTAVTITYTPTT